MMKLTRMAFVLSVLLGACGGSTVPPQEERPASWTAGDDEPLDAPDDGGAEAAEDEGS